MILSKPEAKAVFTAIAALATVNGSAKMLVGRVDINNNQVGVTRKIVVSVPCGKKHERKFEFYEDEHQFAMAYDLPGA